jgi:hypothetical protein
MGKPFRTTTVCLGLLRRRAIALRVIMSFYQATWLHGALFAFVAMDVDDDLWSELEVQLQALRVRPS